MTDNKNDLNEFTKEEIIEKAVEVSIEGEAVLDNVDGNKRPPNKMGTMPIGKLLFTMAVPLMISMIGQALYNLVDSIFVARLNENALTAVSLAFPVQLTVLAVCLGTGIGVNAVAAKRLGAHDYEGASNTAKTGFILAFLSWVVVATTLMIIVKPFYYSQAKDPQILNYAIQYTTVVGLLSLCIFEQIMLERLLQATGKTMLSMITQLVGCIVNIILDPILIYGLFGFPRLEVVGAGLATIIGQACAMTIGIYLNIAHNKEFNLSPKGFRIDWKIIKEIYIIAIPVIVMQSVASLASYFFNKILINFSTTAVAVYGAYFKLNGLIFMPVFALNSSMIPIIAYNYGASKPKRIKKTVTFGVITAMSILLLGTILFELIPQILLSVFHPSDYFLSIGVKAFRIIAISFVPAGFSIALAALFQAVGRATYSLVVNLCRQIIVLTPAAFLLAQIGNLDYVWLAYPIAEAAAFVVTIFYYYKIKKEIVDKLS